LALNLQQVFTTHWTLIAKTGATTASTLRRLEKEPAVHFDVVVTSLGVNDVTANTTQNVFLENQQKLLELLRNQFAASLIVFSGFPPVRFFPSLPQPLRWYLGRQCQNFDQGLARQVQRQPDCIYHPLHFPNDPNLMAPDGFHPGGQVYAQWAAQIAKKIIEYKQ
jgi:lysophospholipase L1-like esterase